MTASQRLLSLAGYDPTVARALGPGSARRLSWIALAHALPCALMGVAAGYATHLAQGLLELSVAAGVLFGLFVLNLLRVSVAGGGMAPHKTSEQVGRFRPAAPPVVVVAVLSTLLAQPAILPLFASELEPHIAQHRAALLRQHHATPTPERVTERSEAGRLRRERAERYARNVAAASFAAKRVTLAWRKPWHASALTLAFVLACLLPLLLARVPLVAAVRHYELVRRQRLLELLHALDASTAAQVHVALVRYPTYEGPAPTRSSRAPRAVLGVAP